MTIDLNNLFKLRAAVGRYGEMDVAGWWNTLGVLAPQGAAVYKRGLARTHFFARVRLVSSVARLRSASIFPAPRVATLWSLPPALERDLSFEERTWATNANGGEEWQDFEAALASPDTDDLVEWLAGLGLTTPDIASWIDSLAAAPGHKGIEVPGPINDSAIRSLAAAHTRAGNKDLIVPFIQDNLGVELG